MKSEWKVQSNVIGGNRMYQVFRIKNINQVHHSGNMEYCGELTTDREKAQELAEKLNQKEKESEGNE